MVGPTPERQEGELRAHDSAGQPAETSAGRRPAIKSTSVSCASAEYLDHTGIEITELW